MLLKNDQSPLKKFSLEAKIQILQKEVPEMSERTAERYLEIFSEDGNRKVLMLVASNGRTQQKVLAKLAKNRHWAVRLAVAENVVTSLEIVKILSMDRKRKVRKVAIERLEIMEKY